MPPPPLPEDQRDADHINLLVVFHYVYMGLLIAGLGFLVLHFFILRSFFGFVEKIPQRVSKVDQEKRTDSTPGQEVVPPGDQPIPSETTPTQSVEVDAGELLSEVFGVFAWFYLVSAVLLVLGIVGNAMSARKMGRREGRIFSMIVAGFNCMSIPLGTVLGVFTFVVLGRRSIATTYEMKRQSR